MMTGESLLSFGALPNGQLYTLPPEMIHPRPVNVLYLPRTYLTTCAVMTAVRHIRITQIGCQLGRT